MFKKQRHSGGLSSGGFSLQLAGIGPKKHPVGYLNEYPRTAFSYTGQSAVTSGVGGIEVGASVGITSVVSVGGIGVFVGGVVVGEHETRKMASKMIKLDIFILVFSPSTWMIVLAFMSARSVEKDLFALRVRK